MTLLHLLQPSTNLRHYSISHKTTLVCAEKSVANLSGSGFGASGCWLRHRESRTRSILDWFGQYRESRALKLIWRFFHTSPYFFFERYFCDSDCGNLKPVEHTWLYWLSKSLNLIVEMLAAILIFQADMLVLRIIKDVVEIMCWKIYENVLCASKMKTVNSRSLYNMLSSIYKDFQFLN